MTLILASIGAITVTFVVLAVLTIVFNINPKPYKDIDEHGGRIGSRVEGQSSGFQRLTGTDDMYRERLLDAGVAVFAWPICMLISAVVTGLSWRNRVRIPMVNQAVGAVLMAVGFLCVLAFIWAQQGGEAVQK